MEASNLVFIGFMGAGKTTVLRSISRMIRTEGEIHYAGRSLAGAAAIAKPNLTGL